MIVFKGNKGKNKGKQPKKGMKKPLKCCDFRGFHLVRETGLELCPRPPPHMIISSIVLDSKGILELLSF